MTVRRAPVQRLASGETALDAATSRYLARVLRLDIDEVFVAFDPRAGREADARIVRIEDGVVVANMGALREAKIVAARSVTLVQGLAKGEKCDAIVRDATELGATEIIFVATERSVVQLDGARAIERVKRWSKIASEAARQSGRGEAPAISISSWSETIEAESHEAKRFVLDPHANAPLAPLMLELCETDHAVVFAVGPEGGFAPSELEMAEKQAWKRVRFGRTTLRTETATAAFLGALRALEDLFGT
ncbi:MAG: 16S rRNA (uracil(1498)-N(3))-methyltransferase [Polyangiaceae bacterium]